MFKFNSKEEAIAKLIENPAYDSDWVNVAADLLSAPYITQGKKEEYFYEAELAQLSAKQLSIVSDAVTVNKNISESYDVNKDSLHFIPMDCMITLGLNATQMEILKMTYAKVNQNKDIDDEIYVILSALFDCKIPYAKLSYIAMGISEGFTEIIKYINYDAAQIAEIYSGWKDQIDYKKYAFKHVNGDAMSIMRHALVLDKVAVLNSDNTLTIAF